jgi:hypothetical protein
MKRYLLRGMVMPMAGELNSLGVIIRIMSVCVGAVRGTSPVKILSRGVMNWILGSSPNTSIEYPAEAGGRCG